MRPVKLQDETRSFAAPQSWDESEGPCDTLSIYDYASENGNVMVSAWMPDDEERKALIDGAVLYLHIHGAVHPVVGLAIQGL